MTEQELRDLIRRTLQQDRDSAGSEAGGNGIQRQGNIDPEKASFAELLKFTRDNGLLPQSRMGEVALGDDDPLVRQFIEQFGERDWGDVEAPDADNRRARGYVMGYGDPTYGPGGGVNILKDKTRIIRLPDGRYIREEANIDSDEVAGQHRADETRNRETMQDLAMVLAGPIMGAFMPAGNMVDVMAAAPGQGFGTAMGTASNLGGGVAAGAGVGANGYQGGDFPHGTEMPNTYDPNANPLDYFGQGETYPTPGEPGVPDLVDTLGQYDPLPTGEMPNYYEAGANPTDHWGLGEQYYTPGLGQAMNEPSWFDTILNGLSDPNLQQLAGLGADVLTRGQAANGSGPRGRAGSVSMGGGGSSGGGMRLGKSPEVDMMEVKGVKPVPSIAAYLRGGA